MIKVSVIVPVYNVEKYLDRCLESLVNQTYKNIEIIVVNDESPDNSNFIINKYATKFPKKIKSFEKENGGLSDARNYGLERASGDYIIFIDSDDYVENNMISKMVECAKNNNSDIVACNIIDEYEKTGIQKKYVNEYETINGSIYKNKKLLLNRFAAWNKMYRASLFEDKKMRFEKGKIYEDLRLILKLYTKADNIAYVNDALYHYIIREGSIMTGSSVDKNLDIISAFDDVIDYYKKENIYNIFEKEIEYLVVEHVLLAAVVRVLSLSSINNMKNNIKPYIDYVETNFKDYIRNPYISNLGLNKKTILFLVNHRMYFALKLLIDLRNAI